MKSPGEFREEARRLISAGSTTVDPELKKDFATRAFELSQRAEVLENKMFDSKLLYMSIARYRSMLAGQLSDDQRRIIHETLIDAEELSQNRIVVEDSGALRRLKPRSSLWCIYQNWLTQRGARMLPDWRDIYPIDARFSLGLVSLIDVTDHPRRFRYRLVSRKLTERLGYEMTGRYVEDIPDIKTKMYVQNLYAEAVDLRAPLYERNKRFFKSRSWEHEVLVLPLSSDGKAIDMLMIYRETYDPKQVAA
jgi:hypothetical protein